MGLRGRENLKEEVFYFITTTIKNFANVFSEDIYCNLLINNIRHYQEKYAFEILAYVIMPTHFHWIVKIDPSRGTISDIMRDIKKYSAWDILEQLEKNNSSLLHNFLNSELPKQNKQFWMHRFDDEVIRDQRMLWSTIRYIHNNPVEAGLVNKPENYKYSSAINYLFDDNSILYVEKSRTGTLIT
jgi:REP element-mobilizing transposase RayT